MRDYRGRTAWQAIREGDRVVTLGSPPRAYVIWRYRSLWLAKPLLSKGGAMASDYRLRSLLQTLWKSG